MSEQQTTTGWPARRRWWRRAGIGEAAVLFGLFLVLGAPNLVYPFGTDQGEYAYIAQRMLDGQVIYRDVFNVKPPVTHLIHALALEIFGQGMVALRLLDWLWQAATAVTIGLIARRLYQRRYVALITGLVYGIGYYSVDFWHSAQTDGFVNLPIALSVLAFLAALTREHWWLWLLSGLLVGIAVLTKYPIGLMLPFMMLLLPLIRDLNRQTAVRWLYLGLGFSLPLLFFLANLALRGGLTDFLQTQLGYIPHYNSGFVTDRSYLAYTWERFVLYWDLRGALQLFALFWLAEVLLSGIADRWPREQWIVPLWGLVGLVYPAVQNHYNEGHLHTLLPPLALMSGHLIGNLESLLGRHWPRIRPLAPWAGLVLLIALFYLPQSPYEQRDAGRKFADLWAVASGEKELKDNYLTGPYGTYLAGFSARAIVEAGDFLREQTAPGEEIFVWGFEPAVYYLSDRDSASRFIYNFPLYGRFVWPEFRDTFLQEMVEHRPAMILVGQNEAIPWISGTLDDSQAAFEKFHAFRDFVSREYQPAGQVAHFIVYERQDVLGTAN
jgi:4-amino-4-deoxy-L-arabinose transferase-like glycosyltransferase